MRRHVTCPSPAWPKAAIVAAAVAVSTLTGCSLSPSADVIRELAKDPATVSVIIMTPYGSMKWLRSSPGEKSNVEMDGNSLKIERQ